MGRIKAAVSDKTTAKLAKQDGMHAVGDPPGLYLLVNGDGRSWILRYLLNGRRRDLGLGSYIDLTLAEAREKARAKRKLIAEGIDPIEDKKAKRAAAMAADVAAMTFRQCVTGYVNKHGDGWKNPKHRQQWENTLETYAGPVIGDLNVNEIDLPHILKVLEPIWKEKTETASRLRGRIESVLAWATVRKYRHGLNPARWKGHLDQLLAKPSKVAKVEHHAALPFAEIGAFMVELRKQGGMGARALEFAILTATRSGEVRGATWAEIDMDGGVWTIPAGRMKAEKEHRVPLSAAVLSLLKALPTITGTDLVFPGAKEGKPLSDMTLTAALRRMNRGDLTAHGFRSTFRDWAGEISGYAREVIEHALAHQLKDKAEASYARGTLFEKRRRLMQAWAEFCDMNATGEVIPLRSKTAA